MISIFTTSGTRSRHDSRRTRTFAVTFWAMLRLK